MARDQKYRQLVYQIVRAIPPGRVMTYGGIGALIPPPAGTSWSGYTRVRARWVGYALADCPEDVPWYRVVNAQGRISPRLGLGPPLQRTLLKQEGTRFDANGRLDLPALEWKPSEKWLRTRGLLEPAV
ncbi:MAG: MGMT family protein [Chloroflexota bacterium]